MSEPIRNPNNIVISVSMSRSMLAEIDERARALGISRSQYLCQLARQDVAQGGDLTLKETPKPTATGVGVAAGNRSRIEKYPPIKRK